MSLIKEETEVKKDIEWLIDDIANERERFANPYDDKEIGEMAQHVYDGKYQGLTYALNKIDQLDEPEVPKQEEVNQAYKDGYEKGKQHTFYKGYLEGLADKEKEPETVADVLSTFWKSFERLKEVMSMGVEELEE